MFIIIAVQCTQTQTNKLIAVYAIFLLHLEAELSFAIPIRLILNSIAMSRECDDEQEMELLETYRGVFDFFDADGSGLFLKFLATFVKSVNLSFVNI